MPQTNTNVTHVSSVGQQLSYIVHQCNHSVLILCDFDIEKIDGIDKAATALNELRELWSVNKTTLFIRSFGVTSKPLHAYGFFGIHKVIVNIEFSFFCFGVLIINIKPTANALKKNLLQYDEMIQILFCI